MYVYPNIGGIDCYFFRIFGPGLGNSLLIWSKAKIYSKKYNLKFLSPYWFNLKVGSLIRGDYRFRKYNEFINYQNHISKKEFIKIILFNKKINENFFKENFSKINFDNSQILIVNDHKDYFELLVDHKNFIKSSILDLIKTDNVNLKNIDFQNTIGFHIRRADFKNLTTSTTQTSIKWFVYIKKQLDLIYKNKVNYKIFSDALSNNDLYEILHLDRVERAYQGNAISDLIALSKCKIIVGSKNSTFSHWASFLSSHPTIWDKGCVINNSKKKLYKNETIVPYGDYLNEKFIDLCINSQKKNFNETF